MNNIAIKKMRVMKYAERAKLALNTLRDVLASIPNTVDVTSPDVEDKLDLLDETSIELEKDFDLIDDEVTSILKTFDLDGMHEPEEPVVKVPAASRAVLRAVAHDLEAPMQLRGFSDLEAPGLRTPVHNSVRDDEMEDHLSENDRDLSEH